jgi:hypothetical protein
MENSSGQKAQWKRTTEEQRKIMAGYEVKENFFRDVREVEEVSVLLNV